MLSFKEKLRSALPIADDFYRFRLERSHRRGNAELIARAGREAFARDNAGTFEDSMQHWLGREIGERSLSKGDSLTGRLQRDIVLRALDAGKDQQSLCAALLKAARVDAHDTECLRLYLQCFRAINGETINKLSRAVRSERVAVHVSCLRRVSRARKAVRSFQESGESSFSSVIFVGAGEDAPLQFDEAEGILSLPCDDSYEALPTKVAMAIAVVSMLAGVSSIVKLDDDHRLASPETLRSLAREIERQSRPIVLGASVNLANCSAHHRAWHFGKCNTSAFNDHAFGMIPPIEFARGGVGYLLNRSALDAIRWYSIYFADFIASVLYEDMCVGALVTHAGGRVVDSAIQDVIYASAEDDTEVSKSSSIA